MLQCQIGLAKCPTSNALHPYTLGQALTLLPSRSHLPQGINFLTHPQRYPANDDCRSEGADRVDGTGEQQHMRVFRDLVEFKATVGTEIGVSDWIEVPQEQIARFAEATFDD